jgi:RND family efflux transporter MFP subunit
MSARRNRMRTVVHALVIMAGAMSAACATQAKTAVDVPLPRVPVVSAQHRDIPLQNSYTGRVEAVHTVELRPRVSGELHAVLFREGQIVQKGAPLFRLDQRPYMIAVRRAEAEAATIAAQLTRAREESARAERLVASDAISIEEMERRRAEVATFESRLEMARAQVNEAALHLEFTTIVAPVTGRIGRAEVTVGNLVDGQTGSATRLAVLHSTDPVYVYFDLDPATASEAARSSRTLWRATVTGMNGGTTASGPIDFVDNGVGTDTGTLRVRARLNDIDGALLPGAVVRVIFHYGIARRSTVIPEVAIGTDQAGRYVLIATDEGMVEYRPVLLGAKAGPWRVVTSAIQPGDRIVLPGLPGLRPGMKVAPVEEAFQ